MDITIKHKANGGEVAAHRYRDPYNGDLEALRLAVQTANLLRGGDAVSFRSLPRGIEVRRGGETFAVEYEPCMTAENWQRATLSGSC